ncbi:DUF6705 family protein [Acetobacteroides hydrogenigenes]|uniref:DUF6705 domain-containing protein n=1 Tax=Acetobacteroides hydrogenigenes TaxID=979970 RepID=A0A4R2E3G9_9BACT|nr:DUF6705 family protein [Acetobacteroides hydrogenigenes]TCN62131.1 hypothetical protein CLV25_12044 [Acetobacteroides hydrogenigenes]
MIEKALKLLLGGFLVASTLACFGQQPFRYYKQEGAVGRYVGTWQAKTDTSCFTLKLFKCRVVYDDYDVEGVGGTYEYTLNGKLVYSCLNLQQDTVCKWFSKRLPITAANYQTGIPDSVSLVLSFRDWLKNKSTFGRITISNGFLEWQIRHYSDHHSLTIDGKPISPPLSEGWSVPIRAILRRVE